MQEEERNLQDFQVYFVTVKMHLELVLTMRLQQNHLDLPPERQTVHTSLKKYSMIELSGHPSSNALS